MAAGGLPFVIRPSSFPSGPTAKHPWLRLDASTPGRQGFTADVSWRACTRRRRLETRHFVAGSMRRSQFLCPEYTDMNPTNPKVDPCFEEAARWREEMEALRKIILECPLTEELKWGKPFYSVQGGNVLVIWGFKDHAALGFCKGALLHDAHGILSQIGENTQAVRKVRFTSVREIAGLEPVLKAYIHEAIEVERSGREVAYKATSEFVVPAELQKKLDETATLKNAFEALTPGRQRGYLLHFAAPKQAKTRAARVDKCTPQILAGKGLNDR